MGSAAPLQLASSLHGRGYRLGPRLGKGSYAKVKVAERRVDGHICAVKIVNRRRAAKEFLEKFLPRELSVLLSLDHRNVIKVFEVIKTEELVCVVMEYAGAGDLLDYVKRRGYLAEGTAAPIFAQVCEGVRYLHSLNICHRDLKCENILLRRDLSIALSDFGFSRTLPSAKAFSQTYCGSAAYASPELLRGKPYQPLLNDVWSLGCVLFILVTGQMPFYDKNTRKMMTRQLKGKVNFPEHRSVSPPCREVIGRMLEPNTALRYHVTAILEHPWLSDHTTVPTQADEHPWMSTQTRAPSQTEEQPWISAHIKAPGTGEEHQHPDQPDTGSVEVTLPEDKSTKTPDSPPAVDKTAVTFHPEPLRKIEESLILENDKFKDPIPRESSRLSYCSMDSEEDRTTSGTTELRSLCRIPGKACILRVLRHTTSVLSRIEDTGSEFERASPSRQGSGSSVDSTTSYLVSSSTCIHPAPAVSPPPQQPDHHKVDVSDQREGATLAIRNTESKADRNFKMKIQKILQIPKKMSARLLANQHPNTEKSNDSLSSDASGRGTALDATKGSVTSMHSDKDGVDDFKSAWSPAISKSTTNKDVNGIYSPPRSDSTRCQNESSSPSLSSEQTTNDAQSSANPGNTTHRSSRPTNGSLSHETPQKPPSRKKTPTLPPSDKTRVQQEGLVQQMRRIFESKDATTSTDQRHSGYT